MFHHHDSSHSPAVPATGSSFNHGAHRSRRPADHGADLPPITSASTHHWAARSVSLDRIAFLATLHCLSGCAIGEVLGLVIGTALGWSNAATIALAVAFAFVFGYALTLLPLLRHGMTPRQALKLALAADTASIALMELVDNLIMLVIPGAMDAGLDTLLFWGSLAVALLLAGVAAFPLNRWLIARGRGHAVVHGTHGHG